jgi:phage head maturation protease
MSYDEGFRDDIGAASVHDVDGHEVAVDFPHEVVDSYRTSWGKGCWDESFARRLPVMCFNHNPDLMIGAGVRSETNHDRTRIVGRFADLEKVPKAGETFSLLSDGLIPGWSFHFRNGVSEPHPDVRNARRYTKADMLEFSPVPFPSIPGAVHTGLRAEEATIVATPTLSELRALRDDGTLTEEGFRAQIAKYYPDLTEHIRVKPPTDEMILASIRADAIERYGPEVGKRIELNVGTLAEDGKNNPKKGATPQAPGEHTDPVSGTGAAGGPCEKCGGPHGTSEHHTDGAGGTGEGETDGLTGDARSEVVDLVSGVDAALNEARGLIGDDELRSLPENVQHVMALLTAAASGAQESLEVLGVDPAGSRAALTAKARNDLDDSDFAYIEPGAKKDGPKSPENGYHFPIQDAAHVRNALSRIAQGAEFGDKAKAKVMAAAKKFGVDADGDGDGDGNRSEEAEALASMFAKMGKPVQVPA